MIEHQYNSQQQIVDYLKKSPFATEGQLQENIWGYYRNKPGSGSNKTYADILRRALRSGKISRIQAPKNGRKYWFYYIPIVG